MVDRTVNLGMTTRTRQRIYREQVTSPAVLSRVFDVVLALGVTIVGLAEIWVPFQSRSGDGSPIVTSVFTVLAGMALVMRRRYPLPTLVVVVLVVFGGDVVGPMYLLFFGGFVPIAIAVFSAARHGRGRVPWMAAGVAAVALLVVDLVVEELQSPSEIVFHWGVTATVWGFGYGLRRHEQRAEESTRRAVQAEVAATEQAMAAVLAERTRIARELHDIVAHSVSTMVVQAGAAEQVVGEDPELARRALATIRATGADALGEMRRVVAMLREEGDGADGDLAPQPGLDGLPELLAATRTSGLEATLEVHGTPQPLPPGLELTGFRVVQEALTNARRHSGAASVRVVVEHDPAELRIEVRDDGPGAGPGPAGPTGAGGHGLVGMRERVAMYGGHVEAGPGESGGFVVRVVLPLEQDRAMPLRPRTRGRDAVPEASA
jgi:signal transduction histidine kinase